MSAVSRVLTGFAVVIVIAITVPIRGIAVEHTTLEPQGSVTAAALKSLSLEELGNIEVTTTD
jgi:hypothetical protein